MTEYELINPSDPYTFIAEDFETAALTVLTLGTTYGAKPKGGGEDVPLFFLGGSDYLENWYKEHFGRTPNEGAEAKRGAVADSLASFMLGVFEDRRRYEAALAAIDDPEKKTRFINEWQEGCSSLNNIGGRAHKLAELLRKSAKGGAGA